MRPLADADFMPVHGLFYECPAEVWLIFCVKSGEVHGGCLIEGTYFDVFPRPMVGECNLHSATSRFDKTRAAFQRDG
jgi:hypothetical protein